jgi:hypothetical protein
MMERKIRYLLTDRITSVREKLLLLRVGPRLTTVLGYNNMDRFSMICVLTVNNNEQYYYKRSVRSNVSVIRGESLNRVI